MLNTWDEAINLIDLSVTAKRRRYRGLLSRYAAEFHDEQTEFGELAELVSTRVQPGARNVSHRSIELENLEAETGRILGTESVNDESALRSTFHAGDTLFGKLRPYLRKFARPSFDGICSTEIWVLRARRKMLDPVLLSFLVQTPQFDAAATKQSGSRMPRADWDLVSTTPIPCPRDLSRQSEVSALLSEALNAVQSEMVKRDILRIQKRGLMQKVFSGCWQ